MAPTEDTNGAPTIKSRSTAAGSQREKTRSELAQKLRMSDATQLGATIATYQNSCHHHSDDEFARAPKTFIELQGNLYGLPLWPCLLNTQGGPKRNSRGQILNVWGKPIKRLYSAGELGSVWGFLYQSGGNLGECLGLGRMAGTNAAAESFLSP